MVSKYSGLTHANLDPPSAPFTRTPRLQVLLGFKGMCVELADDSTCGPVFTAASKSRMKSANRSGRHATRFKRTYVTGIRCRRTPGPVVARSQNALSHR